MSLINPYNFPMSQQNRTIVEIALVDNLQPVVVQALAGTGKSSNANMLAHNFNGSILNLTFSKHLADEAKNLFPEINTDCRTIHSLAYQAFGYSIVHKLKRPTGAYKNVCGTGTEIFRYFRVKNFDVTNEVTLKGVWIALLVKGTLAKFEQSADFEITQDHLPWYLIKEKLNFYKKRLDEDSYLKVEAKIKILRGYVLNLANKLWQLRIDPTNDILATHDTYLKLYQLSKPHIAYDMIIGDEFQDQTPCVIDIFKRQQGHAKLFLIGDANQAIYGWRGAVNGMEAFKDAVELPLNQSWRYGVRIAEVAKRCLIDKPDLELYGNSALDDLVGDSYDGIIDYAKPVTMLYRTNGYLLADAVQFLEQGERIAIEIDTKEFVKKLNSVVALRMNMMSKVKHEDIVPFESFEELEEEAKNDKELSRMVSLVKNNKANKVLAILAKYERPINPDKILTTAHKSKGREWEQVVLGDDFPSPYNNEGEWVGLEYEEQCLLYVASTRAKLRLQVNETILDILERTPISLKSINNLDFDKKGVDTVIDDMDNAHIDKANT